MSTSRNKAVTVFCSSSATVAPVYLDSAAELGCAIAREGWDLVYGGNKLGSMGALADSCRGAKGKVIGITPQLFIDKGFGDGKCHELIVTPDMRSRKERMEAMGDAFIALPGGFGTLEELSEILVGRLLKSHAKPVVLLNISGFYNPLLQFFDIMIEGGFAKPKARMNYIVTDSVPATIAALRQQFSADSHSAATSL